MLHQLFAQGLSHQLAGREDSTDESDLKALVIHLQFVNDGDDGFAQFFPGVLQNFAGDFVAIVSSLDNQLTETGDPIVGNRWGVDRSL